MKPNQSLVVKLVCHVMILALIQGCAKPTDSGLLTGVHTVDTKATETDEQMLVRVQKEQAKQNSIPASSISEKMTRAKTADEKKEAKSKLSLNESALDPVKQKEQKTNVNLPAVQNTQIPVVKPNENKAKTCIDYTNLKLETVDYIGEKPTTQIQLEQSRRAASKAKKDKTDITKNTVSKDTENIKLSNNSYLTIKDLAGLNKISDSDLVVFRTKIGQEKIALSLLVRSNENVYCRIEGASAFADGDALTFSSQGKMLINKTFDIYEDRLEFINSNGNLSLICTHTTAGFFLEDVAKDLAAYITLTTDKAVISGANFTNPFTQDRTLNAVQILDILKMNQITMSEDANDVLSTESKSICKVIEKIGEYDLKKTYFKVAQGPSVKSANAKTKIESSVYQADKDNYFVMACQTSIDAHAGLELMKAAKDTIKFQALDRIHYNEKYKEALDQREINNPTGKGCQSSVQEK